MKHKSLVLAICLILVTCISACSSSVDPIVGSWEAEVKEADFWNNNAGEYKDFFDFSRLSFTMELELKEDKAFTMQVNEDSIETFLQDVRSIYTEGLPQFMDYLIERNHLDMTVEEALDTYYGTTIDGMVDMMMTQVEESMNLELFYGTYRTSGDELHLLHDGNHNVDEVFKFQCDGNTLILDIDDKDDYDIPFLNDMLPLIFTKKQ